LAVADSTAFALGESMRIVSTAIASAFLLALWTSPCTIAAGLTGTVLVSGTVPKPKKLDVVVDQFACGTEKEAGDLVLSPRKELANAVVWIENPPDPAATAPDRKIEMDQKACVFIPRVVVVPAKGTVFFLNSDRLLHNIHTTPKVNVEVNRTQPKNRSIPVTFDKPEIVRIGCDLHPWMTAWVVVAAHPYYAVTGTDGQFAFDVPPGQYKLKVWHERLGTVEASATVGDKGARVSVEMPAR
jgi:plastocyanin